MDKVGASGSIVAGGIDLKVDKIDQKAAKVYGIDSTSGKAGKLGPTV